MNIDLQLQWHSPDLVWAAVFVRDGEPWFLDGALVGMDASPSEAVGELFELARHLVVNGENFLTEGPMALEDRIWLFKQLDTGWPKEDEHHEMYLAVREANGNKDPYRG